MSISALGSSTSPAATTASAAASSTASAQNPVAKNNGGAVASAVTLAGDASVIATLGGGAAGTTTYSAVGLLNSITEAGAAPSVTVPSIGTDTSQVAQLANDAGIVDTLGSSVTGAGVYSATGTLANLSSGVTATYQDTLASNPGLTSTFVGASFDAGIVSTINTVA